MIVSLPDHCLFLLYSGEQVWPIGLLFIKTSLVKNTHVQTILAAYLMLCIKK